MDKKYCNTNIKERKRGEHLGGEERGAIQQLKKIGYSNRAIAKEINCSPSTVGYELKRGTPEYSGRGRKPCYSAKRGGLVYKANRRHCSRPRKHYENTAFIRWAIEKMHTSKWSFDTCVGRAKLLKLFPEHTIPCTKTLYNLLWKGKLPITLFELPEVLSRRVHGKPRIPKRLNGKSIEQRPVEVDERKEFGHWESDTVIGCKKKGEPAVFSIVERLTGYYITVKINGKTTDGVADAMKQIYSNFRERFSEIFRTITTDNGSEFAAFSDMETYGTKVYFAHPYSSWERPVNERSNRLLRKFVRKGIPISKFTDEQILMFSDSINSTPRKRLGYRSPEELFENFLDKIYSF